MYRLHGNNFKSRLYKIVSFTILKFDFQLLIFKFIPAKMRDQSKNEEKI